MKYTPFTSAQLKKGWFIFAISAILFCYEFFLRISPSVMTNDLMKDLQINALMLGTLGGLFFYSYTLMQLPVGILLDRFGPRRLLVLTCFLCAIGIFIFGIAPNFWIAAVGRLLIGFAAAFAFVGIIRVATLWLPVYQLATATGLLFSLGFTGAIIGDNVLSIFEVHFGWRALCLLLAVIGIVWGSVLFFFLQEVPAFNQKNKATPNSLNKIFQELKQIIKNPYLWLNGIIGLLMYFPTNAFAELWGIPYFMKMDNLTKPKAAEIVSLIFLGWVVGALFFGWLSDRLRLRRTLLIVGSFGAAICFSLFLFKPNLPFHFIEILLFLFGVFSSSEALNFPIARELCPENLIGTGLGFTNLIVAGAGILAQPITGLLIYLSHAHSGNQTSLNYSAANYEKAMILLPILLVIAGVLSFFLKETGKTFSKVKQ